MKTDNLKMFIKEGADMVFRKYNKGQRSVRKGMTLALL